MNPKSTKRQKEQARTQKRLEKEAERERRKKDKEAGIEPEWMKEPPTEDSVPAPPPGPLPTVE